MNKKTLLLGSLVLGATSLPTMAATFQVPTSFQIMYVDLHDAQKFGDDFKVNIKPGKHQFVVRYKQIVSHGDNDDMFSSQPIIIDMDVSKDEAIQLQAPMLTDKSKANIYSQHPTFSIVNENGQKLTYKQQTLPLQPGFQLGVDYVKQIKALENGSPSNSGDDMEGPAAAEIKAVDKTTAFSMLKFWYNKSDETTRKDIRIWMIDHSYQAKTSATTPYQMLKFWFNKANKAQKKAFQVWLLQ
ncbi:YccT family protein [Celerinatantimonas yamalensis]|uniref:DUF2057 domain-containing protein n=1 Tax=Celerinatantimonas yamalensis TaxID=559956 RepID=A0ABW9G3G4_9GAMM